VIIVHELLRNSFDCSEYILMTRDFYQIAGGCPDKAPEFKQENIAEVGKIDVVYYRLIPKEEMLVETTHKLIGYYWLLKLEIYRFLRIIHLLPDKHFKHLPIEPRPDAY